MPCLKSTGSASSASGAGEVGGRRRQRPKRRSPGWHRGGKENSLQVQPKSTTRGHAVAIPPMTGRDLRALREKRNLSQAQFAPLVGTTKSNLSQIEWRDRPVPALIAAGARAIVWAAEAGQVHLPAPRKGKDALHSKNFSQPAPFDALPSACPICKRADCRPKPIRDFEQDSEHLWVFSGVECHKSFCLNKSGQFAGTPDSLARPAALRKFCSKCGRLRTTNAKFRSRLGCKVTELYCRRAEGDAEIQEHDPRELFREENGLIRRLTEQEIIRLHGKSDRTFPWPSCMIVGCVRYGKPLDRSGTRLGDIAAFRCRGGGSHRAHYEFRAIPAGEVVHKVADGQYQWVDAHTGELREKKAIPGGTFERRPHRHPAPPDVTCPDHPENHLRRTNGPWTDPKTRKLRWQYGRCAAGPQNHPGWTCSYGEKPRLVVPRPKRRWEGHRRVLSRIARAAARNRYERLKSELKRIHDFIRSIEGVRISRNEKTRLVNEHRLSFSAKVLGCYWDRLVADMEEQLLSPKAWTPAEKAKELLAPEVGYTVSSFSRSVVRTRSR